MNSTLKRFFLTFCVLVIMVSLFALPKVYEFSFSTSKANIIPKCVIQPAWGHYSEENYYFSRIEISTYAVEIFLCAILAGIMTMVTKVSFSRKAEQLPHNPERIWDQS